MQEHPVPQNVTGYEFHLIGQMTLKQFMEVAGGIVVAVVINATNLPEIIRYPLMGVAGLTGLALAFLPLEGRPLDRWFFAFIRSIYQPTLFYWKKTDTTPPVFQYHPPKNLDTSPQVDYTPIRQSRVQEYLTTIRPSVIPVDEEDTRALEVLSLFTASTPKQPTQEAISFNSVPRTETNKATPVGHVVEMVFESDVTRQSVQKEREDTQTTVDVIPEKITPVGYQNHAGIHVDQQQTTSGQKIAGEFTIVNPLDRKTTEPLLVKPVQTVKNLPFPSKPTTANMIVGMVVTSDDKILENAIVTIIKAADKTPVRALKTNALGQFGVVTPLESGSYIIEVEKDEYRFDNESLVLNNQVVDPILIKAVS